MVFYLPESIESATTLDELTPRQIVTELDKYVVGQTKAKRCVAVALRNRMRRQKLPEERSDAVRRNREKLRAQLREGRLDERQVELDVRERSFPAFEIVSSQGIEEMDINIKDILPGLFGQRTKKRRMRVAEAMEYLSQEEENRLIDMDQVTRTAVQRAEQSGIIFIDEIDKIAGRERGHGPDVSREGVQRDILPIVEGTTVNTRYGMVRTDHILFIAAGALHVSKPSGLIPGVRGRFPIRVGLESLHLEGFVRI